MAVAGKDRRRARIDGPDPYIVSHMRRPFLASAFTVAAVATTAPAVVAAQPAPASTEAPPVPPPVDLIAAGSAALEAGKLDVAEATFSDALTRSSPGASQAAVWYDLCLTRYAAGAYGDAINACYRALAD